FLPDPFLRGRRIYKTGDMARRLPDGAIQLAGRRDHQVKIRGHRVELGEVEAVLERHPSIQGAVVIVHGEALIAYVVAASEVTVTKLRAYVRDQLPPAMHPAAYLF